MDSTKIKITFHIGMGKTGTSSIQAALSSNSERLYKVGVKYMGSGLGSIFTEGQTPSVIVQQLARMEPAEQRHTAQMLLQNASEHPEINHFIFSSESYFQAGPSLLAFFSELREISDLHIVAYLRHPELWLPSAYAQWGLDHKTTTGPIQSFEERCQALIQWYQPIELWNETFGEVLSVREHKPDSNVVDDFAEVVELDLLQATRRKQNRRNETELLLRAIFNDRFKGKVLPTQFQRLVLPNKNNPIQSRRELLSKFFDESSIPNLIATQSDTFKYIHEKLGLDFLTPLPGYKARAVPTPEDIDEKLIDYLTAITIEQASRIHKLETRLSALEKAQQIELDTKPLVAQPVAGK